MPPSATRRSHLLAIAQAVFVTMLWSSSWVLITIGLDDLPPLTFAGMRYALAALILGGVCLIAPRPRRELRALPRRRVAALVVLGLVMYSATQGAQFVGLTLLPPATLSLFLSLTPVVVALVAVLALGERLSGVAAIGLVAVTAGGIGYFVAGGSVGASLVGVVVGVVACSANAAASLLGRRVNGSHQTSALVVTTVSMTAGAIVLLGVGLITEPAPVLSVRSVLIVVVLAAVNTAFAFTVWNHTLRRLRAADSAVINNTMVIQIALLSVLVLGQQLGWLQWLALGLVALGTIAVSYAGTRPSAPARGRAGMSPVKGPDRAAPR